jgi:hypothetical protein
MPIISQYFPHFSLYDGTIFHGSEGWIGHMGDSFDASSKAIWKTKFKADDEQLMVSPEHNRNFIDCVKSRHETICPVEMAIRCDAVCQLATIAAVTGRTIEWNPKMERIVNDVEAAKMLIRPYRDKWKVW